MKTCIALLPALALLASASPLHFANSTSGTNGTSSVQDAPSSDKDVSFEHLASNTTTPGIDSLPTCALPCIQIAVKTASDCELTDLPCMCKKKVKIAQSAKACIVSTCGAKKALSTYLSNFPLVRNVN
ncbi:hypothetical protein GGI35DRAFT_439588 [Trichoderma velutinum]